MEPLGRLSVLPSEIIIELVGNFLDVADVGRLRQVNSSFSGLLSADSVWFLMWQRFYSLKPLPKCSPMNAFQEMYQYRVSFWGNWIILRRSNSEYLIYNKCWRQAHAILITPDRLALCNLVWCAMWDLSHPQQRRAYPASVTPASSFRHAVRGASWRAAVANLSAYRPSPSTTHAATTATAVKAVLLATAAAAVVAALAACGTSSPATPPPRCPVARAHSRTCICGTPSVQSRCCCRAHRTGGWACASGRRMR